MNFKAKRNSSPWLARLAILSRLYWLHVYVRMFISSAAFICLAACGGGGGGSSPALPAAATPAVSTPSSNASPADARPKTVPATIAFQLPETMTQTVQARGLRRPQFISTSNVSIKIVVTPQGGAAATPVTGMCTAATCNVTFTAVTGANGIVLTLYDGAAGTGNVLGSYSTTLIAQPVGVNTFKFTANGAVDHVSLSLSAGTITAGTAGDIALTVNAIDKDNNTIIGSGNYVDASGVPLSLVLSTTDSQAGGTGTITIKGPMRVTAPGQRAIFVHYDGKWLDHTDIIVRATRPLNGALTPAVLTTVPRIVEFTIPTGNAPWDLTTGPDGYVYFTDENNNQVGRVSPAGTFLSTISLPSATTAYAIRLGPDGNLWVAENSDGRIARVTPAGAVTAYTIPTSGAFPTHLRVGPDGNFWFTEQNAGKIGRMTPAGVFSEYSTPSGGSVPFGITTNIDGKLWFAEIAVNKIASITTSGQITEYTVPTAGGAPQGIIADSSGTLWFTERDGNKIGKMTLAGVFTEYTVPTGASSPEALCLGPGGSVWFTEKDGNKIASITPTGTITEYAIAGSPRNCTMGPDGNLWFADNGVNKIGVLTL